MANSSPRFFPTFVIGRSLVCDGPVKTGPCEGQRPLDASTGVLVTGPMPCRPHHEKLSARPEFLGRGQTTDVRDVDTNAATWRPTSNSAAQFGQGVR